MLGSVVRSRIFSQSCGPTLRRNLSTSHTTAQELKSKGLFAPTVFLIVSSVFQYGLLIAIIPSQPKKADD
ncbi:hypothetical protein K7432_003917 [Basidiobolus ranarum]|uniref:Uncharacterized protein n=1 Tax=Basidiobolus ranarum TaxID=34480 RepID=A0ABR2W5H8_9FUNG